MTEFEVVTDCGTTKTFDSRSDAEEGADTHEALCEDCGMDTAEIKMVSEASTDGGEVVAQASGPQDTNVVDSATKDDLPEAQDDEDPLAQLGEELGTDPLSILPDHMTDDIQGQPAVNKRGYAMIAERFDIEASADIEVYPWENEEGRCVARATAVTEDGREYSGWATACADDGDMDDQIIELAETRSLKRCVSWASGVGIVSYQELASQLEGR